MKQPLLAGKNKRTGSVPEPAAEFTVVVRGWGMLRHGAANVRAVDFATGYPAMMIGFIPASAGRRFARPAPICTTFACPYVRFISCCGSFPRG